MKPLRVLFADDNPSIVKCAREILEPAFEVVGVCINGESLLRESKLLAPDIIVIEISLGCTCGLALVDRLLQAGCTAKIVFLTLHEKAEFISAAFAKGASGYLLKSELSELPDALSAVARGERYLSATLPQLSF